jgi:hypothetical protein
MKDFCITITLCEFEQAGIYWVWFSSVHYAGIYCQVQHIFTGLF